MNHQHSHMKEAIQLSFDTMRNNTGGPFGAVVVKDGSNNEPAAKAPVCLIKSRRVFMK